MKGITAHVFRWSMGDCSLGGISGQVNEVTVIGCPGGEIFEATPEAPAVRLVKRTIYGREVVHAEPVEQPAGSLCMMGGAFIHSSDSRFAAASGIYGAVALHDRFEGGR